MLKVTNNLPQKTGFQQQLGYLSNLKTAIKDSLVSSINWLYDTIMNKLGETDISSIGDGTITGAIQSLDSNKADNSLVGNDKLSTNASTLTGAVNEINNNLDSKVTQGKQNNVWFDFKGVFGFDVGNGLNISHYLTNALDYFADGCHIIYGYGEYKYWFSFIFLSDNTCSGIAFDNNGLTYKVYTEDGNVKLEQK